MMCLVQHPAESRWAMTAATLLPLVPFHRDSETALRAAEKSCANHWGLESSGCGFEARVGQNRSAERFRSVAAPQCAVPGVAAQTHLVLSHDTPSPPPPVRTGGVCGGLPEVEAKPGPRVWRRFLSVTVSGLFPSKAA